MAVSGLFCDIKVLALWIYCRTSSSLVLLQPDRSSTKDKKQLKEVKNTLFIDQIPSFVCGVMVTYMI